MGLLDKRLVYSLPTGFEYPQAYDYWLKQQQAHWLPFTVGLAEDISNWDNDLTEAEKSVIGRTLKGFTQFEIVIEDYWQTKVSRWFKKPEIQMTAATYGAMESIHAVSYAYLQEQLGMRDFDAFLFEPSAKARLDRLIGTAGKTKEDIALSLAVFSAFSEGVSLFSSFAVLLSFSMRNLLKGVGTIIAYSQLDETEHSNFGCWLFKTFVKEYPEVLTQELKEKIYEAARLTTKLEDEFIDQSFILGPIEGISAEQLKAYVRSRVNIKLKDLGLKPIYKPDKERLKELRWIDVVMKGAVSPDFFSRKVVGYSKAVLDWSDV
jgi:ribonucleoside-diphosphate reductase beta chain